MTAPQHSTLSPERAANLAENPYAGQGSVLLDIGGDVGAVILHLPGAWEGAEVEYRRTTSPTPTTTTTITSTTITRATSMATATGRTSRSWADRPATASPTRRCSRSSSPDATSCRSPTGPRSTSTSRVASSPSSTG